MIRNRVMAFDGPWAVLQELDRRARGREIEASTRGVPTNVWADGHGATVALEMPGLEIDAIEVSVDGDLLTVRGERLPESADGEKTLSERTRGAFARSVRLPFEAETEGVTATYERGVLLVRVPKAEAAKPTRVAVTAAA